MSRLDAGRAQHVVVARLAALAVAAPARIRGRLPEQRLPLRPARARTLADDGPFGDEDEVRRPRHVEGVPADRRHDDGHRCRGAREDLALALRVEVSYDDEQPRPGRHLWRAARERGPERLARRTA